jgi:hypothetical protein
VFSTFCSVFSSNPSSLSFLSIAHPSTTPPYSSSRAHPSRSHLSVSASLSRGVEGQKRKEKTERNQKEGKKKRNLIKERLTHSSSRKWEPIRLGEGIQCCSFSLARKTPKLHHACPVSYLSLIVPRTPTPSDLFSLLSSTIF